MRWDLALAGIGRRGGESAGAGRATVAAEDGGRGGGPAARWRGGARRWRGWWCDGSRLAVGDRDGEVPRFTGGESDPKFRGHKHNTVPRRAARPSVLTSGSARRRTLELAASLLAGGA